MYRQGLTTTQIAATAAAAPNTVRYHLAIAAATEPSIRDDHRNANHPKRTTRITPEGLQNLHDTIALYRAEGRLASSKSPSARERALATWLTRRLMWLHIQRMKYRRDELDQDKETQLNTLLPGGVRAGRAAVHPDPGTFGADKWLVKLDVP